MTAEWREWWLDFGIVAGVLSTVIGIFAAIIAGAIKFSPRVRKWRATLAEKETRAAEMAENVKQLIDDVKHIKGEVQFNGGSSIKDMIAQQRDDMNFERVARRMANGRAIWEGRTNQYGRIECVHVSAEWERLTGQSKESSDNGGWLLAVARADRERVDRELDEATSAQQVGYSDYDCINVQTRVSTPVRHTMFPVWGQDKKGVRVITGWLGELVVAPMVDQRKRLADL